MVVCRAAEPQAEEERARGGREATAHGVHGGSAGATEARVWRQQVSDGRTSSVARRRAATQRVTDQDMVPEQTSQDEEGQRSAQPVGAAADGAGTLQPFVRRSALTAAANENKTVIIYDTTRHILKYLCDYTIVYAAVSYMTGCCAITEKFKTQLKKSLSWRDKSCAKSAATE